MWFVDMVCTCWASLLHANQGRKGAHVNTPLPSNRDEIGFRSADGNLLRKPRRKPLCCTNAPLTQVLERCEQTPTLHVVELCLEDVKLDEQCGKRTTKRNAHARAHLSSLGRHEGKQIWGLGLHA